MDFVVEVIRWHENFCVYSIKFKGYIFPATSSFSLSSVLCRVEMIRTTVNCVRVCLISFHPISTCSFLSFGLSFCFCQCNYCFAVWLCRSCVVLFDVTHLRSETETENGGGRGREHVAHLSNALCFTDIVCIHRLLPLKPCAWHPLCLRQQTCW